VVSDTAKLEEEAANHDYAFSFLQDLPLGDYHRLEGYLYPDTYEFTTPQNPLYVINKMLVRFDAKLTEELRQQIADSGRTIHEVLTVASLIEKETDGADRADIASVIYNRLNNPNSSAGTNGYLQIDATLAYLNGSKVPTEADKSIDSPYNTYLYPGLPPGPISNPGIESILAAINPNSTSYYYYVLGDDNRHHFFNTWRCRTSCPPRPCTATADPHTQKGPGASPGPYFRRNTTWNERTLSCSPPPGTWSGCTWRWPMGLTRSIWRATPSECAPSPATSPRRS